MLTVTGCALDKGAGVPVGIPNESSPGETDTAAESGTGTAKDFSEPIPKSKNKKLAAKLIVKQALFLTEFMAHPTGQKPVDIN